MKKILKKVLMTLMILSLTFNTVMIKNCSAADSGKPEPDPSVEQVDTTVTIGHTERIVIHEGSETKEELGVGQNVVTLTTGHTYWISVEDGWAYEPVFNNSNGIQVLENGKFKLLNENAGFGVGKTQRTGDIYVYDKMAVVGNFASYSDFVAAHPYELSEEHGLYGSYATNLYLINTCGYEQDIPIKDNFTVNDVIIKGKDTTLTGVKDGITFTANGNIHSDRELIGTADDGSEYYTEKYGITLNVNSIINRINSITSISIGENKSLSVSGDINVDNRIRVQGTLECLGSIYSGYINGEGSATVSGTVRVQSISGLTKFDAKGDVYSNNIDGIKELNIDHDLYQLADNTDESQPYIGVSYDFSNNLVGTTAIGGNINAIDGLIYFGNYDGTTENIMNIDINGGVTCREINQYSNAIVTIKDDINISGAFDIFGGIFKSLADISTKDFSIDENTDAEINSIVINSNYAEIHAGKYKYIEIRPSDGRTLRDAFDIEYTLYEETESGLQPSNQVGKLIASSQEWMVAKECPFNFTDNVISNISIRNSNIYLHTSLYINPSDENNDNVSCKWYEMINNEYIEVTKIEDIVGEGDHGIYNPQSHGEEALISGFDNAGFHIFKCIGTLDGLKMESPASILNIYNIYINESQNGNDKTLSWDRPDNVSGYYVEVHKENETDGISEKIEDGTITKYTVENMESGVFYLVTITPYLEYEGKEYLGVENSAWYGLEEETLPPETVTNIVGPSEVVTSEQPTATEPEVTKPQPTEPVVTIPQTTVKEIKTTTEKKELDDDDDEDDDEEITTPKKPSIVKVTSLKNKKGKKAIIKFAKVKRADGYQVQYSLKKKMKSSKSVNTKNLTYTFKKLKKRRYYFRVRAYIKYDGEKIFGKWSNVKNVMISK